MEYNGTQPKTDWKPFLYGAIAGAVIGWPLFHHLSRDTGDAPSVAIGVGLSYIAVALAGGVGGLLLQGIKESFSERGSLTTCVFVGFTVLTVIFLFLLWFCFATIRGVMTFRGSLNGQTYKFQKGDTETHNLDAVEDPIRVSP